MRIVTLIHGTWAKGATWTKDDSRLVLALRTDDPTTRIERLEWSGGNSHAARLLAAEKLAHHIRDCHKQNPAANHYVIAHSHGGNVLRYALSLEMAANKLNGAVCLSTPFITSLRRLEPNQFWARLVGIFFMLLLCIWPFTNSWLQDVMKIPVSHLYLVWLAVMPFGFIMLLVIRLFLLPRIYLRWRWISGVKLLDSFQGSSLPPDRLLIIRPGGDEASMGIGFFQFMTWMWNRIAKRLDKLFINKDTLLRIIYGVARKYRDAIGAIILFLGMLPMVVLAKEFGIVTPTTVKQLVWLCVSGTWLVMLLALGLGFVTAENEKYKPPVKGGLNFDAAIDVFIYITDGILNVIYLPLTLVMSLFSVAFGWEMPFFSLFLTFSIEASPPGKFSVYQLQLVDASALSHSIPYDSTEAIVAITDWMKRLESNSNPKG